MLRALIHGRPLILYIVAQEQYLRSLLTQENNEGKENDLCYISWTLMGAKLN